MRRALFLSIVLVAVVLAPAPADAGFFVRQRAHAMLVLPERNGVYPAFFVEVSSLTNVGTYSAFALRRGNCFGRPTVENCYIEDDGGIVDELGPKDTFTIDPDLETARLEVTRDGVTHTLSWRATGPQTPVVRPYTCGVPGPAVGVEREAVARGRLFGHRLRVSDASATFLEALAHTAC